jgi:hypothetical protein
MRRALAGPGGEMRQKRQWPAPLAIQAAGLSHWVRWVIGSTPMVGVSLAKEVCMAIDATMRDVTSQAKSHNLYRPTRYDR